MEYDNKLYTDLNMYKSHIHKDIQEQVDMKKHMVSEFTYVKFSNRQKYFVVVALRTLAISGERGTDLEEA